jgi:hypothetical protein
MAPELTPCGVAPVLPRICFKVKALFMLARDFDPKIHCFRHLANAIEIALTF